MKTLSRLVRHPGSFTTNVVYRATADFVSKAVTLAITVAAARVLSPTDFGVFALAMTTGWLLSVASDAGLPLVLAKHVALHVGASDRPAFSTVSRVMRLRGAFGALAAVAGLAIAAAVAPEATAAFFVIVLAQLLNAVLETLAHAYRGLNRNDIESGLVVVQRSVTAIAALAALVAVPSLLMLSIALAIPPAIALLASWRIAGRLFLRVSHTAPGTWPAFARRPFFGGGGGHEAPGTARGTGPAFARGPFFGELRRGLAVAAGGGGGHMAPGTFRGEAAPIGLGILLSALYFRCDVYFVERWHGLDAVGVYNAAFRLVEALRLFPAAVLAVSFPMLCRAADAGVLRRLTTGLVTGGAILAALLYLSASSVLGIVYGPRFVEAAPALRLLAVTLPLFFANYALTHQVIAWDAQRAYVAICAIALASNVLLNTLLIPTFGMTGAAMATFVTELVVAAGCLVALSRTTGSPIVWTRARAG